MILRHFCERCGLEWQSEAVPADHELCDRCLECYQQEDKVYLGVVLKKRNGFYDDKAKERFIKQLHWFMEMNGYDLEEHWMFE